MALMEGRAGFVTGAGAGIGEAIAKRIAAEGASVVVADVDDAGGERVVREITEAGGTASYLHVDVSSEDDVRAMVDAVVERYGTLDFAMNNAGIGHLPVPLHEMETAQYDKVMAIDARGVFLGLKYAIAYMREHDIAGSIVNTASGTGLKASKGLTAYVTSKHAAVGLTRMAAIDYAEHGIRVNAVAPGSVKTPQMVAQPADIVAGYEALMPSKRMARPEEIAAAVVWLLSDEASYVSGDIVEVDFGYLQAG
ncbi:SDR family NAD(P)-dependent oxidoreductase [Agrococcus baldri]|uniref:Short chain dehydrogenase n=1 Tax=Agrococcus baldri TaxID=153730 RepID=A0AA87RE05_9MICO|nr:SDR family NAD(P)-dependent oxidoreductase [Agrococcus baldri]GEK81006.1 short chain dehydrogenase [Agrococcus baldri]